MWVVFYLYVIELYCKETVVFSIYLIMNKNDYFFLKKNLKKKKNQEGNKLDNLFMAVSRTRDLE
jgi:hypothetical protein